MPSPKPRKALILIFALGLFLAPRPATAADDAIVAVVNSEIITLKDFREYLNALYMQMMAEGKSQADIDKIMADYEVNGIEQLIEDKLLVDEATRKGMEIRPKAVDERIEKIKSNYPSEQEFLDALTGEGLTVTDLRNKITDQFKAKYIMDSEVRSKIYVNPQEVTDYYESHITDFQDPEKVELDSIYVSYKEDVQEARVRAQGVEKLIKEGKNSFKELAEQYSDSPSIGTISRGQLLPTLERSIFKLNEGEISSLMTTNNGIYIFHILKKIPAKTSALDEVKDNIYNIIFQQKYKDQYKTWIDKLRSHAYIEIKK